MPPESEVPTHPVSELDQSEPLFTRVVTFGRLEAVSFVHSCIYTALLVCAFALNKPEPATFVLDVRRVNRRQHSPSAKLPSRFAAAQVFVDQCL